MKISKNRKTKIRRTRRRGGITKTNVKSLICFTNSSMFVFDASKRSGDLKRELRPPRRCRTDKIYYRAANRFRYNRTFDMDRTRRVLSSAATDPSGPPRGGGGNRPTYTICVLKTTVSQSVNVLGLFEPPNRSARSKPATD